MVKSLVKDTLALLFLVVVLLIFLASLGCLFVGWFVCTCASTYMHRWYLRSIVCSSLHVKFAPLNLLPKPSCNWTWGSNKEVFVGVIVTPTPKMLAALPSSFAPSTVSALRADLKANGVKGYSKLTKTELINLWYRYC